MAHEIRIPRLGWSMEVGTFLGWKKQAGEWVSAGEPLFDLEGEKASQEIEAIDSGVLQIDPAAPAVGMEVPVGTLLGYLVPSGEPSPYDSAFAPPSGSITPPASATPVETDAPSTPAIPTSGGPPLSPSARRRARELGVDLQVTPVAGTGRRGRVTRQDLDAYAAKTMPSPDHANGPSSATSRPVASPRARRLARELQLDWRALAGTGRNGRVRASDVQLAAQARDESFSVTSVTGPGSTTIPPTKRRRVIARRMLSSHQETAPVTLTTQLNAKNLVNLREQFKATSDQVVPSYNDLIVKLVAGVLLRHPHMTAQWHDEYIVIPNIEELAIGLAVDTDDGLLVPVLRRVTQTPLLQLARDSATLIADARAGRLAVDQLQGAHFTVTNLGAMGIDAFTPVINLPESAILGVGAIRREAVVGDDDTIVPGLRMTLSLTFDHRVNDGAPAARFLADIRESLENPIPRLMAGCY